MALPTRAACPISDRPNVLVGVPPADPFVIQAPDGSYTGFDVELWNQIAERLGCTSTFVPIAFANRISALQAGTVDVVIGGMTVTSAREVDVDFSHAYFKGGQAILSPDDERGLRDLALAFWHTTASTLLMGLVLFVLFWAVVIWAAERYFGRNNHTDDDASNDLLFSRLCWLGLAQAIWFVNVTMTTVGYGDYTPKTLVGRILTLMMMWTGIAYGGLCLVAIQVFGTEYANAQHEEISLENLKGMRVAVVSKTTGEEVAQGHGIQLVRANTFAEALDLLRSGAADAMVFDAPSLRYVVADGQMEGMAVSDAIRDEWYAMAFASDSALRDPVNVELLGLLETGAHEALKSRYFGK